MSDYEIIGMDDDDYGSVSGDGTSEIIGSDYEIIGADDDLLDALSVGAARKPGKKAIVRRVAQKGAMVVKKGGLSDRRRFPLGFIPTTVVAGATATVPAAPQNLFRTERLVIPSDIAFNFGIVDFKVGNESQFVSGGEVPAAMFTEVAIDTQVHFKTAEVGNQISIQVRNKGAGNLVFVGGLIGTVAR